MQLSEIRKMHPDFEIMGREGKRVGFYCNGCREASTVAQQHERFSAEHLQQFTELSCLSCQSNAIESIWEDTTDATA